MTMTIAEQLESLQNTKTNIKNAIENKNVNVPDDTPFSGYPALINRIGDKILIEKTITRNGIYLPANDSADGYKKVIVNVQGMPVIREKVTRECDDWHAVSPAIREKVTRECISDYHCYSTTLNVTQNGGVMYPNAIFQGGYDCYLVLSQTAPLSTASSWEFQTKYTHRNSGNSNKSILGFTGGNDNKTPSLQIHPTYFGWWLGSNGYSWDINNAQDNPSSLLPVDGETYYLKAGFSGTEYYIDYNTTGWDSPFTRVFSLLDSTKVFCDVPFMLLNSGLNTGGYYSEGLIYLPETRLIINGSQWFVGATVQNIF